ncbi:MAG: class I adenylate-forming enzyme family protein [Paracoccaceae bacterium]
MAIALGTGQGPGSDVPWADRHVGTLIARGFDRPDDQILAYVAGEGALGAGEVKALVTRIRAGLRAANVGRGDRVALDATQRIESFLLACAILLEGAAIVRIGDNVGAETMVGMLRAAPPVMTFTAHLDALGADAEAGIRVSLDPDNAAGAPGFPDWLAACPEDDHTGLDAPHLTPTDIALIGFTSGSTGTPKPVSNTHEAIWRSTETAAHLLGLTSDDIFFSATDFVAMSEFRSMLSLPLYTGGRVVFPSAKARTDPLSQALEAETYGVTCLTAVPNVLRGFLAAGDRLGRNELRSLRRVMSGSGVLDAPTAEAFHARFGRAIVDYYGKRETATNLYSVPDQVTTMSTGGGRAAQCLVRVLDAEGQPAAPGEVGEIVILTDCAQVETSDPVTRTRPGNPAGDPHHGWHRTGDFGRVLANGNIVIAGRKSDIIKTPDGQLLLPVEVENIPQCRRRGRGSLCLSVQRRRRGGARRRRGALHGRSRPGRKRRARRPSALDGARPARGLQGPAPGPDPARLSPRRPGQARPQGAGERLSRDIWQGLRGSSGETLAPELTELSTRRSPGQTANGSFSRSTARRRATARSSTGSRSSTRSSAPRG